jgi:hypothetical protein
MGETPCGNMRAHLSGRYDSGGGVQVFDTVFVKAYLDMEGTRWPGYQHKL